VSVLVTLTVGLVWWIVAWSFGIKAFDAFLITIGMTLVAVTIKMVKPFLQKKMGRTPEPVVERPSF